MLINAGELATCSPDTRGKSSAIGVVEDGAMMAEDGKVTWVGTTRELRRKSFGRAEVTVDAEGSLVTPGFVDPHTHLLFAGSREDELERKLKGESYTEILKSGGGIARTVRETRGATSEAIERESLGRLGQLVRNGVTTAEVKTGYGQSLEEELRHLEILRNMKRKVEVELVTTFLGLHSTPPEFARPSEFVKHVIKSVLPAVARLRERPRFSDCFCEEGVFSSAECRRYLEASADLGFALKIHADEFKESGGARLAAEVGCMSADHLGRSSDGGIEEMGRRGVVAVLLPWTSLCSGIPYADARKTMDAGCRVALGTDLSPNSWIESPQLVMGLACNALRMTPEEAILGFTRFAADALGREDIGRLAPGASADFLVHDFGGYRALPYELGGRHVRRVFKKGIEIGRGAV